MQEERVPNHMALIHLLGVVVEVMAARVANIPSLARRHHHGLAAVVPVAVIVGAVASLARSHHGPAIAVTVVTAAAVGAVGVPVLAVPSLVSASLANNHGGR